MLAVRPHDIHTQSTKEGERGRSGMTSKRFGIIGLVMVMMASMITACSGSSGKEPASGDSKEKVTFTYFNATAGRDINTNETRIGKILEDQTGVNWKLEHLVGDSNTKIGTFIASNDFPDVIVPDGTIDKVCWMPGLLFP